MSRPTRPWFRFYTEAVGDPKLRTLTPTHRWLWVAVLAAARQSPDPGILLVADEIPHTITTIADYAGVKERDVESGMVEFQRRGMVELDLLGCWSVPKFGERQYESDNSTVRTRKHRSREPDGNVPWNVSGTDQKTETETEPSGGAETSASNGHEPPQVQILVSGFVDDYRLECQGHDPPSNFRAAAGKAIKTALKDGEQPDDIARCLGVIAHEGKNPSTLAYVLGDMHANRPRRMR